MTSPAKINLPIVATNETDKAFAGAQANVDRLGRSVAVANAEMATLGSTTITPVIAPEMKAEALAKAKADMAALQTSIATNVMIGADTSEATRKVNALGRSMKALQVEPIIKPIEQEVIASYASLEQQLANISQLQPGLSKIFGPAGLLVGSVLLGGGAVKAAADLEQLTTQLEVLVGSHDKAQQIVGDLRDLSAHSVLNFSDLTQAATTLAAFGVKADDLVQAVKDIGEAASGSHQPVADLALIWGQMLTFGAVDAQDMRQFVQRGVQFWPALAAGMNVSVEELQKMHAANQINAADIATLIQGFGKVYAGDTAKLADTFNGKLNQTKSNVTLLAQSIGKDLVPAVGFLLQDLNSIATSEFTPPIVAFGIQLGIVMGTAKLITPTLYKLAQAFVEVKIATLAGGPAGGLSALGTSLLGVIKSFNFWAIVLTAGVTLLETFSGETKKAADAQEELGKQINFAAGEMDKNNLNLAAQQLEGKGLLKTLGDLDISTNLATKGLLGNAVARDQVLAGLNAAYQRVLDTAKQAGIDILNPKFSPAGPTPLEVTLGRQADDIGKAIKAYTDLTGANSETAASQARMALATGEVADAATGAAAAINGQADATLTLTDAIAKLKGTGNEDVTMFEKWKGGLTVLVPWLATSEQATKLLNDAVQDQAKHLQDAQSALSDYISSMQLLDTATLGVTQTHLDFQSALDKLYADIAGTPAEFEKVKEKIGRKVIYINVETKAAGPAKLGLDVETETGRANLQNLIQLSKDAEAEAKANITAGMSKSKVLELWDQEREKIIKATELMGHFTRSQAEAFLNQKLGLATPTEVGLQWDEGNIDTMRKNIEDLKKPLHIQMYLEPHPSIQQLFDELKAMTNKVLRDLGITIPVYTQLDPDTMHDAKHKAEEIGLEGGGVKIPAQLVLDPKQLANAESAAILASQKIWQAQHPGAGFVPSGPIFGPVAPGSPGWPNASTQDYEAVNRALVGTPAPVTTTNTMPAGGAPSTVVNPQQTVVNVHVNDARYRDLLDVQVSEMVGSAVRRSGAKRVVTTG